MEMFIRLWKSEKGATSIEYALIAVFTSIVAIFAMQFLGTSLSTAFTKTSSGLNR